MKKVDGIYMPEEGDVVRVQLFDLFNNRNDVRKFLIPLVRDEIKFDEEWGIDDVVIATLGDVKRKVDLEISRNLEEA